MQKNQVQTEAYNYLPCSSGKLWGMSDDLLLLILASGSLGLVYRIWQTALEARETANRVARETCSRAVVQLLDGTVAFAGLRRRRDPDGRRRWLRTYTFDYTRDGFERSQGFVVLAGRHVESVGLADSAS